MKAVIYIRVSTEDQKLGSKAQQDTCEAFCQREGVEVSDILVDQGVSGGTPLEKRDGLIDAINALEDGGILVVAKRCRVARDVLISCLIDHAVKAKGARIVSADGIAQGDGPEAVMMRQILDVFAQYERSMIRLRTRAALRQLRKKGKRSGTIPFGFKVDSENNVIKCDEEQSTIELIMGLRSEGLSLRAISARLKEMNVVGRKGSLNHVQVARIVKARDVKEAA